MVSDSLEIGNNIKLGNLETLQAFLIRLEYKRLSAQNSHNTSVQFTKL